MLILEKNNSYLILSYLILFVCMFGRVSCEGWEGFREVGVGRGMADQLLPHFFRPKALNAISLSFHP